MPADKTGKNARPALLKKQPIMHRVLLALLPPLAGAIYFFGWRSLAMVTVSCIVAFIAEYIFSRRFNEPVSEAVFVTAVIYALIMPPTVGWNVLVIGIVFAVVFSKCVFGGYGRNIFNPAMSGRCFVYICFPIALTATWAPVASGPMGALKVWSTAETHDAVTSATPMTFMKSGQIVLVNEQYENATDRIPAKLGEGEIAYIKMGGFLKGLFFGRISGTVGVTSALLSLIGGAYLFYTRTASRAIILSLVISYAIFNEILTFAGAPRFYGAFPAVLGGGFLFGAFYMATDPISAPKTQIGRIIYGIIIAMGTTIIRNFSIFNGGLMFSILLGNMFGPIIDHYVRQRGQPRQAVVEGAG